MYLYFEATGLLYVCTLITLVIFLAGALVNISLWRKGKAKSLYNPINMLPMIKVFIFEVILQLQILKISFIRWIMHFTIFIGFLGLLAETSFLAFLSHIVPASSMLSTFFYQSK